MLTAAWLRIHGDLLDPEEITNILQITPHVARRKGERRLVGPSQSEVIAKRGIWAWESDDPSETFTINDHITRLRNTFEPVYDRLQNLPNVEYAWVDIYFAVDENEESISSIWFSMDTESIATLKNIGLPVEFTVDTISKS